MRNLLVACSFVLSANAFAQNVATGSLVCGGNLVATGAECTDVMIENGDICFSGDAIAVSTSMRTEMTFSTKGLILTDVWALKPNEKFPNWAIRMEYLDKATVVDGKFNKPNTLILQECAN
ncbi:MAG: hypothetical protein KBD78_06325 [Oligoflexales bacterium]|nr:hypothetical protein [Oligoflexales bacterium]